MKKTTFILILILYSLVLTCQQLNEFNQDSSEFINNTFQLWRLPMEHSYQLIEENSETHLYFYDNNEIRYFWIGNTDYGYDEIIGTFQKTNDTIWINPKYRVRTEIENVFPLLSIKKIHQYPNTKKAIEINIKTYKKEISHINFDIIYTAKTKTGWDAEYVKRGVDSISIKNNMEIKLEKLWLNYNKLSFVGYRDNILRSIRAETFLRKGETTDIVLWRKGSFLKLDKGMLDYYCWNPIEKEYEKIKEFHYKRN